jgi:phage gpG-like protein
LLQGTTMIFEGTVSSQNFDRALDNFQAVLADNSEALAAVADDLRQMIAEQFATEGAAGGTPWAPLAPSTVRRTRGARGGILYATGALLGSLTDPGAPGHVEQLDEQSLLFGSELPYAIYHQTGTGIEFGQATIAGPSQSSARPRGRKGRKAAGPGRGRALPMRPLIVVTDARAASWAEILRAGIEQNVLALGTKELA